MDIVAKFMVYIVWLSAGAYSLGKVKTRKGLFIVAAMLILTALLLPEFKLTWGGDEAQEVVQEKGSSTKD